MGSSDLNLKKSWHVGRAANISAIAKAEADAIAERKKLALRLNEIKEERKKEEIQKQLAAAGGKPVTQRVEWMYSGGPGDGQNGDSAANEAFLLGKRTLDKLLVSQDNEAKELQKQASHDSLTPAQTVNTARDTASKIREDPLLAIRRQEAEAYGAMMNDPIKRRQLLASMGIDDPMAKSKSKEERRHKHRHHHRRRHRDDDEDDEERSRKRRRSGSRSRDRSRTPRRYESEDEDTRRRRRRSPAEKRSHSSSRNYRDKRDSRPREKSSSRSPPRRRRDDSRDRYDGRRDNYREERNDTSSRRPRDYNGQDRPRYNQDRPRYNGKRSSDSQGRKEQDGDERARKLAAMQAAASDLDKERELRLAALEDTEKAAREAEDKARQRSKKLGGDRHFVNSLHHKASEINLAERIGRGRQGLQRDEA
ncbi:pre-mRNA-splicing factor CWC25 [Phialemonium atrogriseum]|uniref:Pre-mRNA-splicing factor CWC25 n=1 Tax=Phialemonium atrogriseum TaxID=1093897 RepID=A0AAJ0BT77_9PEZI|nr:pre-mRNA-splicing factor CWC25 [Phialemonium atrogriseum]KAK1764049.1 pre-mRNA-splicing factor CWC25 [Phialemonium atrogriseum]